MSESEMSALLMQLVGLIQMIGLAGGLVLLMPAVVAIVVQSGWAKPAKEFVVVLSCVAGAAIAVIATHQGPVSAAVMVPIMVYATRQVYNRYWKPTGLGAWIEDLTSFGRSHPRIDEVLDRGLVIDSPATPLPVVTVPPVAVEFPEPVLFPVPVQEQPESPREFVGA